MPNTIHQPHDGIYKLGMGDLRVAKDLFRQHLPEAVQQYIDWSTLALTKSDHIDETLKQSASDIVYSVKIDDAQGYLIILSEHQSSPQKDMALRLMEYSMRIMRTHWEQQHKTLPIVLPLVVYSGTISPYPYSTDFFDLFKSPELAKKLLFKPFQLVDLSVIDDETLLKSQWASFLQLMMKYIHDRDTLIKVLKELIDRGTVHFLFSHEGERHLRSVLYYVAKEADVDNQPLLETIKQSKELEGIAMTLAQQWLNEGQQKGEALGLQKGRQEGEALGRQKTMHELAHEMLADGESFVKIVKYTKLSPQQIKKLQQN